MISEEILEQAKNYIKNNKNIAILLPEEVSIDLIGSATALQRVIAMLGNNAAVFSSSALIPKPAFFKSVPEVQMSLGQSDQFAVKISTASAKPGELRYEVEPDAVVIYLKAKEGNFAASDVSVMPGSQKFDLFITLGVSAQEKLGKLYTEHASQFFETPIVNIDTSPSNEYFGVVNVVSVTESSISELVGDIVLAFPDLTLDDEVVTPLLSGMIEQTQSFRDPKTTPATLAKAAKFLELGARQQDIIQHLFKTKPFPLLQLWGRSLARLVSVQDKGLLYSGITKSDIEKTHADNSMIIQVLRDLVEMVNGYSVIALAAETANGVQLHLVGLPHAGIEQILQRLGAGSVNAHQLIGKYVFASAEIPGQALVDMQSRLEEVIPA